MGLVWFGLVIYYFCIFSFRLCLSFQLCLQLSSLTLLSNSLCFFFFLSPFFLRACSCGQVLRTHVWFVVRSLVLVYVVFFFSCFYYSLRVSVFLCYRDGFPRSSILDVLSTLLWLLCLFLSSPSLALYLSIFLFFLWLWFNPYTYNLIQSHIHTAHTYDGRLESMDHRSRGVMVWLMRVWMGDGDGIGDGIGMGLGERGLFCFFFVVVLFTFFTLYPSLYPLSLSHSLTLLSTQS